MAQPITRRRCGNSHWGKPLVVARPLRTEFETQVERLGLTKEEYATSAELKLWCELNRNRVYVPEWLLGFWGMKAEAIITGAA